MSESADLRNQLAKLQAERKALEAKDRKLSKKTVHEGKFRVDCMGTSHGKCPLKNYQFFKKKVDWRCQDCWKNLYPKYVVHFDKNGPTEAYLALQRHLNKHTSRMISHPDGTQVRLNLDEVPFSDLLGNKLSQKYLDWYSVIDCTPQNMPNGYFWCRKYRIPWLKVEKDCQYCSIRGRCVGWTLHQKKQDVAILQRKVLSFSKEEREQKKLAKEQRTLQRKKLQKEQEARTRKLLTEMKKPKNLCGSCKGKLEKRWWAYNGERWLQHIVGMQEVSNPTKKRCSICYKKGKR